MIGSAVLKKSPSTIPIGYYVICDYTSVYEINKSEVTVNLCSVGGVLYLLTILRSANNRFYA